MVSTTPLTTTYTCHLGVAPGPRTEMLEIMLTLWLCLTVWMQQALLNLCSLPGWG